MLDYLRAKKYVDQQLSDKMDKISTNHIFTDNSVRDAYFISNPSELVAGLLIANGAGYQEYNGSAWVAKTAVTSLIVDDFTIASTKTTANTNSLTATSAETNVGVAVVTKGTGAITTQVPDGDITGGNARGANAVDLQKVRTAANQVAGGDRSVVAGGEGNAIENIVVRGNYAWDAFATGKNNTVNSYLSSAIGHNCIVDGKVSLVEGNCNICSSNDSHAEGNRTVAGRKYFRNITTGSEDAGDDLGVLEYVVIPDAEGDVSSYFPNSLFTDITTRYGAGAQADTKGNVYASSHTPAVWTDDIPTTPNDLQWALHTWCILRGATHEYDIAFAEIAKVVYTAEAGTKVYYKGAKPYATLLGIYGSYASTVAIGGLQGGNGQHAEGLYASTFGYAAHAEGKYTKAWADSAHAEGDTTKATGAASHAEGIQTQATGTYCHAEGYLSVASGSCGHAEGRATQATGNFSHAEGLQSVASGKYAHAEGYLTQAIGEASNAIGKESKASQNYQQSYAVGRMSVAGDNQVSRIMYQHSVTNAGWHVIKVIDSLEDNKAYHFDCMVIGRQSAGTAGAIGDTFAYRFTGCFVIASGVAAVLGTPTRTLIGRSAGMAGDGLTTGVRLTWGGTYLPTYANLRMDGLADTSFRVSVYTVFQEMGLPT